MMNAKQGQESNLMQLQTAVFEKMLSPAEEKGGNKDATWSCIFYDKFSQQVLSTLFKIGDLRKKNVTLHLPISSFDSEIPGTQSLFLVEPTRDSLFTVSAAIGKGLTSSAYIYLLGQIERGELDGLLELLAKGCGDYAGSVKCVMQKNLSFVTLSPNLFSLGAGSRDYSEKHGIKSLLALIKLLQINPLFVVQSDKKAKSFAQAFSQYADENEEKSATLSGTVVIVQKSLDLPQALHHSWFYQPLISENYKLRNNKATTPTKGTFPP